MSRLTMCGKIRLVGNLSTHVRVEWVDKREVRKCLEFKAQHKAVKKLERESTSWDIHCFLNTSRLILDFDAPNLCDDGRNTYSCNFVQLALVKMLRTSVHLCYARRRVAYIRGMLVGFMKNTALQKAFVVTKEIFYLCIHGNAGRPKIRPSHCKKEASKGLNLVKV